jgi:hypothetical protein
LLAIGLLAALMVLSGCHDPLFPEDLPNTPYERYNSLRGQQSAAQDRGALRGKPNLRRRLRPLGEP